MNEIIATLLIFEFLLFLFGLVYSILNEKIFSKNDNIYSYTKAICGKNYCIDYLITCKGDKVINITPETEPVYMGDNWTDPRNQSEINKLCG